jgi:DNA-binding response OmpR family regulator
VPVLVVEDEEPLRRIIVRSLECRGYRVSEAGTVAGAVDRCDVDPPDLLVLDLNLPDGSGWDVLRQLAGSSVSRPAVVARSAALPGRQRRTARAATAFLEKPFPIDALLRAVAHAARDGRRHGTLDHSAL